MVNHAISPSAAFNARLPKIPKEMFEAVNIVLTDNIQVNGQWLSADIPLEEVVRVLNHLLKAAIPLTEAEVKAKGWHFVAEYYRLQGWTVNLDQDVYHFSGTRP